jgi:ELWxxDGT repeat protein
MKTSFWRRWCNSLSIVKRAGPVARGRPHRKPLGLVALEDRVTPALTPQLVLDINTAFTHSSEPFNLTAIGSSTFFTADDGVHGTELWKSDGTAAGTTLVKDICLGAIGSGPGSLTNVNGTLFFSADDGVNGFRLWKSDGTAAGTVLVKDIGQNSMSPGDPWSLTKCWSRTLPPASSTVMHSPIIWRT